MYANGPDVIFAGHLSAAARGAGCWRAGSLGPLVMGQRLDRADLIGVGIKVENGANSGPYAGLPLIAVMPADKVTIERNWDVNGLKGTGSHDMVVDKVVVPEEWTFVRGGASSPIRRSTAILDAAGGAGALRGSARHGTGRARLPDRDGGRADLDHRRAHAGGPGLSAGRPGQGRSRATLRAAFFYEITEEAYDTLVMRRRSQHRNPRAAPPCLDAGGAGGRRCGAAVYRLSGTTGIATNHLIARHLQDAMVVPQHAFLSDGTWQTPLLLGLDAPAGFP
jgi:alkylation response protein AidB-like acyl-CoA dehydrogenase